MEYINISSNSWHYKLYCISHDPMANFDGNKPKEIMPKSLCPYFWSCIAALIYVPFLYLGLFIAYSVIVIACSILAGIQIVSMGIWEMLKHSCQGLWSVVPKPPPKPKNEIKLGGKKAKEPSLVWQYMKARKKKVCPPLSVDGEIESKDEYGFAIKKKLNETA